MEPITVRIVSDYSCPFCFIAFTKLRKGIQLLPDPSLVVLQAGAFQLNASLPASGINKKKYLTKALGGTDSYKQAFRSIQASARPWGIELNEEGLIGNSRDAHRLTLAAEEQGLGCEMKDALFRLHFEQAGNLGDRKLLAETANRIGVQEAQIILESDAFESEVDESLEAAAEKGISAVPSFWTTTVFDPADEEKKGKKKLDMNIAADSMTTPEEWKDKLTALLMT